MGAFFPNHGRQGTGAATDPAHPAALGRFGRLTERARPFTVSFSIKQVEKVVMATGGVMKVRAKFAAGLLAAGMLLAAGCGGAGGGGGGGGGGAPVGPPPPPRGPAHRTPAPSR